MISKLRCCRRSVPLFRLAFLLLAYRKLTRIVAFVSPPPGSSGWETVREYRNRLNITYNYRTKHIDPEYCRFLDEAECERDDEMHGRAKRRLQENKNNNRELKSKSIGSYKVVVLLVRFTDHLDRELPTREYFQQLCDGPEGGSIKHYLQQQSYGLYDIECVVNDWVTTDNTELFYADQKMGVKGSALSQLFFHPVLDAFDQVLTANDPAGLPLSWFDHDRDNDGKIDNLLVFHSGYAAESPGELDCTNDRGRQDRIHSQGHSGGGPSPWHEKTKNIELGGYAVVSALHGNCGNTPAKLGIVTHEMIHTFGAPDVYDFTIPFGGLAAFDIMALPYGQGGNLSLPGSMSPWLKSNVNWLNYTEITHDGLYTLDASQVSNVTYIIKDKFPQGEYLLIENRQPLDYDKDLWTGGLVIYKVDETKNLMEQRGFPGQEGWPANNNHYEVAVLQADGLYELEQGLNSGDAGDVWVVGTVLGAGGDGTFPSTESYQGPIYQTGISITPISTSGTSVTFQVTGLSPAPETQVPLPSPGPPRADDPSATEPSEPSEPTETEPTERGGNSDPAATQPTVPGGDTDPPADVEQSTSHGRPTGRVAALLSLVLLTMLH